MRRRTVLAAIGGSTVTAFGFAVTSDSAKANQISVDSLNVPNKNYDASNPINKARINVNGRYQYERSVTPDKEILRLEVNYANSWEQLLRKNAPGTLEPSQEDTYTLEGNLFDHSMIDPVDLSPQNVGETMTLEFNVRVRMTVRNDGRDLETFEATDTASITVNKTTAEVTGSIEGEGTIELGES